MDYCISRLYLPLHLSLTHYCVEDAISRVRSHEMEGKQRKMSDDATFKRRVILYAEKMAIERQGESSA